MWLVVLFIYLRTLHPIFHSCCTSVHSHRQGTGIPFSPYPYQHLISCLSDDSHPTKWEVKKDLSRYNRVKDLRMAQVILDYLGGPYVHSQVSLEEGQRRI